MEDVACHNLLPRCANPKTDRFRLKIAFWDIVAAATRGVLRIWNLCPSLNRLRAKAARRYEDNNLWRVRNIRRDRDVETNARRGSTFIPGRHCAGSCPPVEDAAKSATSRRDLGWTHWTEIHQSSRAALQMVAGSHVACPQKIESINLCSAVIRGPGQGREQSGPCALVFPISPRVRESATQRFVLQPLISKEQSNH
jgi:hypothetical protein